MARTASKQDQALEPKIFAFFEEGRKVNSIAKEYDKLIKLYPDYQQRVQKVNSWHKKYKKLIMLGISKTVTQNIQESIKNHDNFTVYSANPSDFTMAVDNDYKFQLSNTQIWDQQLKENAIEKAEHRKWVKENVYPLERAFYLEWYKEFCTKISNLIQNGVFSSELKSLIGTAMKVANELKKNPSSPNYMSESIAYLNMLKSEEGAISAGMIKAVNKLVNVDVPKTVEEDAQEIKTALGYES